MKKRLSILLFLGALFSAYAEAASGAVQVDEVRYRDDPELTGTLAIPQGEGPFPAVIYNHGGFGGFIAGPPRETAQALAQAGYVGLSPIRRDDVAMEGNLEDVLAAVDYVKGLEKVDPHRIALLGFSRGGLLVLMAAAERTDLTAIVLMAPAPGRGHLGPVLDRLNRVHVPVLLMVASNDEKQADHVGIAKEIHQRLKAEGKNSKLIVYPPYGSDGHRLFFEVGAYWKDLLAFLQTYL
ncbi:MAG: dienelactone hydrolase family protein [Candidatus Omnitrophica bacterium]|nr:dienelactone hydrolase family protein [Candidatus Omnitrophota bacterium]